MAKSQIKTSKRVSEEELKETLRKRVLAILVVLTLGILGFLSLHHR